jgi:hypothetical protein
MWTVGWLIPLMSLSWDGGNMPLGRNAADALQPTLRPRELSDLFLTAQEQKRYEAALTAAQLPQQTGDHAPGIAQVARQLFKQAAVELQFKQEAKALKAYRQALSALLDKWKADSNWPRSDLNLLAGHFGPVSKLFGEDPQLVLTLLHELDELYVQAAAVVRQRRSPEQVFTLLANLWVRLYRADKLSDEDWDIAAFWAPLASLEAFSDRPLSESERTRYLLELKGVGFNYDSQASQIHRLQSARATPGAAGALQEGYLRRHRLFTASQLPPSARPQQELQKDLLQWEYIDRANIRFMESSVHMKYGQVRRAISAFNEGVARVARGIRQFPDQASITVRLGNLTVDQFSRQEPLLSSSLRNQLQAATPRDVCWRQPRQYQPPVRSSFAETASTGN